MKRVLFSSYLCCMIIYAYGQIWGGEITYENVSPFNNHFRIHLTKFSVCQSVYDLSVASVYPGDGLNIAIPRSDSIILSNNILQNNYDAVYVYPPLLDGSFYIWYEDSINMEGLNYPNSSKFPFHLESFLKINPFLGPNNSVFFADNSITLGDLNKPFLHNPAAIDIDGDSLSFQFLDLDGPDSSEYWIPTDMHINPKSGEII